MNVLFLIIVFALLRTAYVALFGGVLIFGIWNLIICGLLGGSFLSYPACFLIAFLIDIVFSFIRVTNIFRNC